MTAPLQSITNMLGETVNNLESMANAMDTPVDLDMGKSKEVLGVVQNELDALRENVGKGLPDIEVPDIPVPEPIPITWDVQEIDVFKNSGIERFQSEISSATSYLDRMNDAQVQIGRTAAGLDIIPDDAYMDIKNLTNRIGDIRTEIELLERNPMDLNVDQVNNQLETLRSSLSIAERQQNDLNDAMQRMDAGDIQSSYNELNRTISNSERHLRDNFNAQEQFTKEVNNSTRAFEGLKGLAMKFFGIIASGKFLKGGLDRLMGVDTAQAKLQALGHDAVGVAVITNNALDSVTGTAFRMEEAVTTAASAVAAGIKPGQELERYLSLTADTAAVAGSSMQEMGSIFNKIATDGRIQAQELNQLGDRGIPIIQMLAEELGVAQQEVRELASEGKISSREFLNAVESGFGGAAAIMGEASLEAIIDNIGASLGRMSAGFLNGSEDGRGFFDTVKPLLVDLLEWMRSIEGYFAVVGHVFGMVFNAIIDGIRNVANFFQTYWGIIQPIVWGIVAGLIVYNSTMGIAWAITLKDAAAKLWNATVTAFQAAKTFILTVAQQGLNAALATGLGLWMGYALIIIGIVVIFYAIIGAINHFTGASLSATGLIAGAVAWLGALIWNIMIGIGNVGIFVLNRLVDAFHIGIWLIQVAFYALGFAFVIVLDLIITTGILVVNLLVYAWNLGVWTIQMAFIGLITIILLIFDGILNAGIIVVELLANAWNIGIWSIQMLWIGLNVLVRNVLQAILNFGISVAEGFANGWNDAIYGLQMAFYKFQEFVSKVLQAVGQGAIGVINSVLGGISTLVNKAIGGLNKMIGMANNIPGVNISTVGTVDLKMGSGVQSFVDNIGSGLVAPVRAERVSLNRSTMGQDYMDNVEIPPFPEMVSLDRSSITSDFLGSIDIPEFPKWENVIEHESLTSDYLDAVDFPEFPELSNAFDYFEFEDMGEWFDKGYEFGENLANKVKDFDLMESLEEWLGIDGEGGIDDDALAEYEQMLADMEDMGSIGDDLDKGGSSAADKAAKALDDIAGNTDDIKKNTGASKEDLAYLRDLNARNYAKRNFQEISINLGGVNNTVNNEQDLDGVVDYIAQGLEQAIARTAEGVHH